MTQLNFYTYDIETMKNLFLFTGKFEDRPEIYTFEISSRKNQRTELLSHLNYLKNCGVIMHGFNNLGFDYVIIHELLNNPYTFTFESAYNHAQTIINTQKFGEGGNFIGVKFQERIIPQFDSYKMNHFDNANKRTSLKALEFAMRSDLVMDLPFPFDKWLTSEEMDLTITYNTLDVTETEKFLKKNKAQIQLRQELLETGTLKGDVLNFSDVKIGTEYLITKIGRSNCFLPGNKAKKTFRDKVVYSEVILPKIHFRTEPYQEVLDWFMQQVKYTVEDKNPTLAVKLADLDITFGAGGIHGSVDRQVFESDKDWIVEDIDITGAYVATAIVNEFSPEHLKDHFPTFYKQLPVERARYKKGTSMNTTFKLSGNAIFGNADNKYSCFYDPKYAKQCTINCQLSILQMVEMLDLIPGLKMIQANTDGITSRYPRKLKYLVDLWKMIWENETGLKLESVEYKKMWVRDVNNYLALSIDGKIKRKGAYWYPEKDEDYDGVWSKDFGMMVVAKVASEALINGWNPEAMVRMVHDKFDFMMRYKATGASKIYIGDKEVSKTVRYYISKTGESMKKISPPRGDQYHFCRANKLKDEYFNKVLSDTPTEYFTTPEGVQIVRHQHNPKIHTGNKSVYKEVHTSIESGWKIKQCNNAKEFDWNDLDYSYYVEQIKDLLI